jgi:hypothetical protein
MTEPSASNELVRLLAAAANDPEEQQAFARALLAHDVCVPAGPSNHRRTPSSLLKRMSTVSHDFAEIHKLYALERQAVRLRRVIMAKSGRDALMALMEELARSHDEHPGLARLMSWSQFDPTDVAIFESLQAAAEPWTILLATYGLAGDDLAHWFRIIWTSLEGFLALRTAGKMMLPADPDESLHLLMNIWPMASSGRGGDRIFRRGLTNPADQSERAGRHHPWP